MPRTLAENATYIANTIKPAIKQAIEDKGVTVPSGTPFVDYADYIGDISGGGSGYQLKDLPTGSISTVSDAAPLPLNALKVSVEAWQEGSGDPSPSNIRPIHGWDSGEISVVGKNLVEKIVRGYFNEQSEVIKIDGDCESVVFYAFENIQYTFSCAIAPDRNVIAQIETDNIVNNTPIYHAASVRGNTWTATWTGWTVWYKHASYNAEFEATAQIEIGTQATTYEPYQGKQYTLDFPQTIYGAEWDVVDGSLKQTDGYIASYNGESLPSSWISDRDVYDGTNTPTTGAEVVYKLATPTTIPKQAESIRMLEGVNNLYVDCGEVLEGEYFVDEGAIDVRKVDYSIGSNSALKISDGRILQGFVNMSGYHALPLGSDGTWLDIDWSKSFEIGIAFKYTVADTNQTLFGSGISGAQYYKCPMIMLHPASQQFEIDISTTGNSWDMTMSQTVTYASLTINTWYFLKMTFDQSTMSLVVQISDDFSTWDTLLSITMSTAYYHDTASLCFGGFVQNSSFSSNNLLIDTFNTYIKGDGVSWGAFTGAFPS